jgi:hypothetical protein
MATTKKKPAAKPSAGRQKSAATATKKTAPATAKSTITKQLPPRPKDTTSNDDVHYFINTITQLMQFFMQDHDANSALTGTERMRLIGAGVRNYGFIEKAWDIVRENPQFVPSNFSAAEFQQNIQMLDDYRQLSWVLEKFLQGVNEAMLIRADASFRDALRVYNSLKEQARGRVHGAEPLFRALLRFFRRRRPAEELEETEPTIKQLERDFNKMVHGKEDGEIVIKNEKPRMVGGVHEVIDNVHTGRAAIKETAEGSIEE